MKGFSLLFCVLCLAILVSNAQVDVKPSSYVVVGAFSIEKNAVKHQREIKKSNLEGTIELNASKGLYYVHVLKTDNKAAAFELARKLQTNVDFNDAWVFYGTLGAIGIADAADEGDYEVVTDENMSDSTAKPTEEVLIEDTKIEEAEIPVDEVEEVEPEPSGIRAFVTAVNASNNKEVSGDVTVIDIDRTRKITDINTNQLAYLESPNSKSGKLLLVAEIFGYRKEQIEFDTNNPQSNVLVAVDETGTYQVVFNLVRYKKGDAGIMYKVYFFNDAAVMRPESRFEMNSLLDMMKENPNYAIKIHGHSNSKTAGKIISRGKSTDFFSLNDDNVEGFGSSKELSKDRAQAIKDYLVDSGIDEKRMQIKAWGGKRMLYDKHSPNARANARVEIEIIKE